MNALLDSLAELVADIEAGLDIGPIGIETLAPNGQAYQTFVVGRYNDGSSKLTDADLVVRLKTALTQYKRTSHGDVISWRKKPDFHYEPTELNGKPVAKLVCRVMIYRKADAKKVMA